LFERSFLDKIKENIDDFDTDISQIYNSTKSYWKPEIFKKSPEATLESDFIFKVFEALGYEYSYRQRISFQGQSHEPDNTLFATKAYKEEFQKDTTKLQNILLFCESKGYKVELDNTSKDKKFNPHYQLLDYLKTFKIDYGFSTNGRKWRLYDNTIVSTSKTYYEVDLEAIFADDDREAFKYFYFIFRKENFIIKNNRITNIIMEKNDQVKSDVEVDLKNVIYGTNRRDSIFEIIGKAIYQTVPDKSLHEVYENTLYLVFRLLFIAYFEDKNKKLLELHRYYNGISLNTLFEKLRETSNQQEDRFNFYGDLRRLFRVLNEGDASYEVPLFNGGLFNPSNSKLLEYGKLLNNYQLYTILNSLLIFDNGYSLFRRDFKNLSIINLGSIYEGLLEYRFEIASEDIYYMEYKESKKSAKIVSGYLDIYDYAKVSKGLISKENFYKAGEVYLTNSSNSRKSTASYYTPTSLSSFMVKSAIDLELSKGKKPIELKILDNACGSGHFLLEALSYITDKAMQSLEDDLELQGMVQAERAKIQSNLMGFDEVIPINDYDIIKRLMLKKTIFGVDLNPFAVELTKLALWIDSFIFGTPLSFLSHHIKQGNSLIGSSLADFKSFMNKNDFGLFQSNFEAEFEVLKTIYLKIANLQDTTTDEINESKKLYDEEIKPPLKKLNNALNLITLYRFVTTAEHKKELTEMKLDGDLLDSLFANRPSRALSLVEAYQDKFRFFNYEVEFAEMVSNQGFDIVIGNPPWDKTKLDDKDFFSQYRSNYRTLSDKEKAEVKTDLLAKPDIKVKYEDEGKHTHAINEYLKANFPLNRGAGDGNLFRFFVENNLKLLRDGGNLTYVLPSALFQEDGSTTLRGEMLKHFRLNYFYGFENRMGLFGNVDDRYKFGVFQAERTTPNEAHTIRTKFMQTDPATFGHDEGLIEYTLPIIKKFSPQHLALANATNRIVFEILDKSFSKFNAIDEQWFDFRNELHMSADKKIFYETPTSIPLFEGKTIHQFNSCFGNPTRFLKLDEFDNRIYSKEVSRMAQNISSNVIKVTKKDLEKRDLLKYIRYDREYFKVVFREIASDTNERTLIASLLPKNIGYGHKLFGEVPKKYLPDGKFEVNTFNKKLFVLAIFNSIVLDFLIRLNVSTSVSKSYVMRLPIPQPSEDELAKNSEYQTLINNALKLVLFHDFDSFKELADAYGISKEDLPSTSKQVDRLKIENDIIVARMYDITHEELTHILSTFKVFNGKNPAYTSLLLGQYEKA
jgi:type II restriction/modification system DNA methylase subunit YeeA